MRVYLATECKSVAMDTGDLSPQRAYQPAHMATLDSILHFSCYFRGILEWWMDY